MVPSSFFFSFNVSITLISKISFICSHSLFLLVLSRYYILLPCFLVNFLPWVPFYLYFFFHSLSFVYFVRSFECVLFFSWYISHLFSLVRIFHSFLFIHFLSLCLLTYIYFFLIYSFLFTCGLVCDRVFSYFFLRISEH